MDVKTYRASTMRAALSVVRDELGPDAAVLHAKEVRESRLFGLLPGRTQIEVTASAAVQVPSRLPQRKRASGSQAESIQREIAHEPLDIEPPYKPTPEFNSPLPEQIERFEPIVQSTDQDASPGDESGFLKLKRDAGMDLGGEMQGQLSELKQMVQRLCEQSPLAGATDLPEELFHLYTDLIDKEIPERQARELIERIQTESPEDLKEPMLVRSKIQRMIEERIKCGGPIRLTPGQCRIVALVGPTGVGKTTTIAKLAANFRLKEHCRVGLITVDTYRIAAVEQLRTYADIIDLPMEVVSTPREMREAVRKLAGLDLVLMDTAGRSPRDEVKIRELRAMLAEADVDEVHLVLSSVASERTLCKTAERFATVGTTSLLLTKLDESPGLGAVLPLIESCGLPLSYLTCGQNVPDDIETADQTRMAKVILSGGTE